MTFAATGAFLFVDSGNLTVSNQGTGDLLLVAVTNYSNNTVFCSGLSGGGASWTLLYKFAGTANAQYVSIFAGTVTATGAGTVTPTWSGTAPAGFEINGHEFTSTTGAWVLDTQGTIDTTSTNQLSWASLIPAANGELYFGMAGYTGTIATGTTSGYVYNKNADSDGCAFNPSCAAGVGTAPVWGGNSGNAFGAMVLVQEAGAAAAVLPGVPVVPLPPGWFPGADAVTTSPDGIPFQVPPATAPSTSVLPLPPPPPPAPFPPLPPGWFPGSEAVAADPGGIPFWPLLQPDAPPAAVSIAPPPGPQPVPVLGPGWFPGADLLTAEPGDIPFWICPQPDCSPALPAPVLPFLTGTAGAGTGQYFVDQSGHPYLLHWDTVWGIITQAGSAGGAVTWQSDMANYCAARSAEGFNGFLTTPVSTTQNTGAHVDGSTWDNVAPFTSPGVLNNTFWNRVDYLIATAASYGLTVLLDTMYTYAITTSGGPLYGWTTTQYQNYGTAVGARYATTQNLVWHFGDDNLGTGQDTAHTAFLTGIRGAGANQICSIENAANSTSRKAADGSITYPWGTSNAQYNYCYSYNAAYDVVEVAYLESSPLTVCQMDGWYDNQGGPAGETPELFMRKLVWWALSSGSRGYQLGNNDLWYWPANAISSGLAGPNPGSQYMQPATLTGILNLFKSFTGWHLLVPDTSSALVTAGRGTHVTHFGPGGGGGTYSGGNTYVTASITADHSLAVIYNPSAGNTITVNGTLMPAGYTATWVDPASGAQTSAGVSTTYTHSGVNSAGDPDWLLVLQGTPSSPATPAAPGIPDWLPLPPGWFPGADAVTALPGGIPFYAVPQPAIPGAVPSAGIVTGAAAVAGAGTAAAVVTQDAGTFTAVAGAGAATAADVQAAVASAAGAGAIAAAGVVISPAAAAGTGSVSAVATQVAPGTAPGAGTVTGIATQIAGAAAAGAGSVTATGSVAGASTASIAGAGSVTAVVTQAVIAAPAGAGAVTVQAAQGAGAPVAGTGTAGPAAVTQAVAAAAAGAGSVTDVVTQTAFASAAGAGAVTAAGSVTGSGANAAIAGAGSAVAAGTQGVTGGAAGAGTIAAAATQAAKAPAAGAGSAAAAGQITGTANVAGAGTASAVATQPVTAAPAGAGVLSAPVTQPVTAAIAGAGAVSAAGTVQLAFTTGVLTASSAATATLTAGTQSTGGPS